MPLAIEVARQADDALAAALARLLPQLSPSSAVPDPEQLRRIVEFPGNRLLIARDGDAIRLYRRLGFEERPTRTYRHTGPA
jgi:hypothetical protein